MFGPRDHWPKSSMVFQCKKYHDNNQCLLFRSSSNISHSTKDTKDWKCRRKPRKQRVSSQSVRHWQHTKRRRRHELCSTLNVKVSPRLQSRPINNRFQHIPKLNFRCGKRSLLRLFTEKTSSSRWTENRIRSGQTVLVTILGITRLVRVKVYRKDHLKWRTLKFKISHLLNNTFTVMNPKIRVKI